MESEPQRGRLDDGPFHVSRARNDGIGEGRLRGPDLLRPYHGVRANSELALTSAQAYTPLLRPGDRFSHVTAASIWGCPLPSWAEHGPVHVTSSPGFARARGVGVAGHESGGTQPMIRSELPVSDAMLTFLECATLLRLEDLVAIGDYFIHTPRLPGPGDDRPHVELPALRDWLVYTTARGVRRARSAAEMVRPGVESRRETRLRLLLVGAGLPEARCGHPVQDRYGNLIGWFDLVWPEWKVAAEYDGDQHRTSDEQYEKDINRFDRAAASGWRVVRVRKRGVYEDRAVSIRRVAEALTDAGCPNAFPNRRKSLLNTPMEVDL